ncbi:hypothetical protein C8Q76DRAFT_723947 [Earliella scabrosa]|nr:hypothetical protein C8Q76DRAFT_723947 [Earliella scabrosa]
MPDILLTNTRLVAVGLQLFATGAYVSQLPRCASIMVREGLSLWLPAVCVLIFALTITDVTMNSISQYNAFSVSPSGAPHSPIQMAEVPTATLIKNLITIMLALISDAIMVYRTFIIWNLKVAVIIVPVLLLLGDIGLGILSTWTLGVVGEGHRPIAALVSVRVRYFFVLTFAVNALCASLICWRLWRVHSRTRARTVHDGGSHLSRVFEIIIESALLYCAHLLILIVSNSVGSNVFFVFLHPLPPVTALVFTMIIVRTRSPKDNHATLDSIHFWSSNRTAAADTQHTRRSSRGARPVEIYLERVESRFGEDTQMEHRGSSRFEIEGVVPTLQDGKKEAWGMVQV